MELFTQIRTDLEPETPCRLEALDETEGRLIDVVRQHDNATEALLIAAAVIVQYFTEKNEKASEGGNGG